MQWWELHGKDLDLDTLIALTPLILEEMEVFMSFPSPGRVVIVQIVLVAPSPTVFKIVFAWFSQKMTEQRYEKTTCKNGLSIFVGTEPKAKIRK